MQEPRLRLRSGSSAPLKTGGNGESAGKGEEGRSGGIVAEAERLAERKKAPAGGAKRKAGGRAGTRQERHRRLERHRGAAASLPLVRNASSVPRGSFSEPDDALVIRTGTTEYFFFFRSCRFSFFPDHDNMMVY